MEDNVSYVQGLAQPLVIIHHPHVPNASVSKGWGVLEELIGLPAFAASTLFLWVLRGCRGAWAPRISNILGL